MRGGQVKSHHPVVACTVNNIPARSYFRVIYTERTYAPCHRHASFRLELLPFRVIYQFT